MYNPPRAIDSPPRGMESPPIFSESPSPRMQNRFPRPMEQYHASPPYHQYHHHSPQNSPNTPYYENEYNDHIADRVSNKEVPAAHIHSPGLESVWASEGDKEVAYFPPLEPPPQNYHSRDREPVKRRICGMPTKLFYSILVLLTMIAIGLGVGLSIGLGTKSKSSSTSNSGSTPSTTGGSSPNSTASTEYLIGGAIDPKYYSKSGAFNGSGIALASQSFASNLEAGTQGSLVMYFQHHSGQIRWMQLSSSGDWRGGSVSEVVAVDAKNNTPLSAVAYALNGTSTWHIFYVDTNNTLRQRTNSNTTNVWVDGPLNSASKRVVFDADQVGMQACWYGSDYGDSDYTHTPIQGENTTSSSSSSNEVGMHLWYASDSTTFQQLGWRDGDTEWEFQQSWTQKNGHAGVGCYSWGPGTSTYVMFVDTNNTVEIWWRDTNTSVASTASHPINEWTQTSISIPNVDPSSSLGYTNFFYAQMADTYQINGYNISWASENSTIIDSQNFTVGGAPGIPGTHLSVSALPNLSGGNDLVVFYQTAGDDVTEYTRDLVAGQWTAVDLSIPDA
ncbi:Hypothetical protein R9X50_00600600 [Acrodontium crateriforme]|uniref:Fucose-specific lectin n=1 Tax=Acrodontium crateriforme TaxID=150365 RepID=A0AAQ3MAU7_9PEZI|nr:Hypothetical protein R9X50_00600600 [Acrodontium crateriforme]